MKIKFQANRSSLSGKEIWNKPALIESASLERQMRQSRGEGRAFYHSVHAIEGNNSFYPYLFIDVDAEDADLSRGSTIKIVDFLYENGVPAENLQVAFSGHKGFHVLLDTRCLFASFPSSVEFPPMVQREFVRALSQRCLQPEDIMPDFKVYSKNRMIRGFFSINFKSGLFKIPVTRELLNKNIAIIKDAAKRPSISQLNTLDRFLLFSSSPGLVGPLRAILEGVGEMEPMKRGLAAKGKRTTTERKIGNPSLTTSIALSCRAVRQKIEEVGRTKRITAVDRYAIASALARTDDKAFFIHRLFSRTNGYDYNITDRKLSDVRGLATCGHLVESGFCKQECERYKRKDLTNGQSPDFFGHAENDSVWLLSTAPSKIREIAYRLKVYHDSTTDFFDWVNWRQFQLQSDSLSEILSDRLRKASLLFLRETVIHVRKDDNTERKLIKTPFETELASSLFVEAALKSNKKFREATRSSNILSYGYLEIDDSGRSLIRPWFAEYKAYQGALRNEDEDDSYPVFYGDDLKNFYPSIRRNVTEALLSKMFSDERIRSLVLGSIYCDKQFYLDHKPYTENVGLPQGPLISHVIAARLLLEVDELLSRRFSAEEIRVVRYCDDFRFFCRDEKVREKLIKVVLPEIENTFGILFHKNLDGDKSFSGTVAIYREQRLQADLFKYQLKFESELAEADPGTKSDLLELLTTLFGNTFEKYLSNSQHIDLKEIERNITALRWRIPPLLEDRDELLDVIVRLGSSTLHFAMFDQISYKLRVNLVLLLLNIVDVSTDVSATLSASLIEKIRTGGFGRTVFSILAAQLVRHLSKCNGGASVGFARAILNEISDRPVELNELDKENIESIRYLLEPQSPSIVRFNFVLWVPIIQGPRSNVAHLIGEFTAGLERIEDLFESILKADSDGFVLLKMLKNFVARRKGDLSLEVRFKIFCFSVRILMSELEDLFLDDIEGFDQRGWLSADIKEAISYRGSLNAKNLQKCFDGFGDVKLLRKVGSVTAIAWGDQTFTHEQIRLIEVRGIAAARLDNMVTSLNELGVFGQFKILMTAPSVADVYCKVALPADLSIVSYASPQVTLETVLELEISVANAAIARGVYPRVSLSAANLAVGKSGGIYSLVICSLANVLKETLEGAYLHLDGRKVLISEESRLALPGLRVLEHCASRGENSEDTFPYGRVGFRLLRVLKADYPASYYYRKPEAVHRILSKLVKYRRFLMERPGNRSIDEFQARTSDFVSQVLNIDRKRLERMDQFPASSEMYSSLREIYGLLRDALVIEGDEEKAVIGLVRNSWGPKSTYLPRSLASIDQVSFFSLLWLSTQIRFVPERAHKRAVLSSSLFGLMMFELVTYEYVAHAGDARQGSELHTRLKEMVANVFRQVRSEYPDPDLEGFEQYESVLSRVFEDVDLIMRNLPDKIQLIYSVKDIKPIDPAFPIDNSEVSKHIAENFKHMTVHLRLHKKGVFRLWETVTASILPDAIREKISRPKRVYLSKALSRFHGWGDRHHVEILEEGFCTIAGGKPLLSYLPCARVALT